MSKETKFIINISYKIKLLKKIIISLFAKFLFKMGKVRNNELKEDNMKFKKKENKIFT